MSENNASEHRNRLANSTSPYLLQHAANPVDWYPWGQEALERARQEDKPIFLSIGYAACHWCHVMERESFEDRHTAAVMNEHFVCIKVDREERPDIDTIYMQSVLMMTGQGGWPMSVWLTPDLKPYYSGTYFPPGNMYGRPGFKTVLEALARAYREDRDNVVRTAEDVSRRIREASEKELPEGEITPQMFDHCAKQLEAAYDDVWGGFGQAPKFPPSLRLSFLLREHLKSGNAEYLKMAEHTLERMAKGGMYDQVGGGFARYSVDDYWLVPHFEKMLYDNALLSRVYCEAYQLTGKPCYRRIAEETFRWVLREMLDEGGGFHSSLDADSEGEEGKFYVWSEDEVLDILGERDGTIFNEYYDITAHGNFEGHNIPNIANDPTHEEAVARKHQLSTKELLALLVTAREKLYEIRAKRVWPGKDDKVLTAWNGMMISALAKGAVALGDATYRDAAIRAANFILKTCRTDDGRLLATYRAGNAHLMGYLDDYVFMIEGLLDLYGATFDPRWVEEAQALNEVVLKHFSDEKNGGWFFIADDHEKLIARPKELHDGATPNGNGVHVKNLIRLASLLDRDDYRQLAQATLRKFGGTVRHYPPQYPALLEAADLLLQAPREVVVAEGPNAAENAAVWEAAQAGYQPYTLWCRVPYDAGEREAVAAILPLCKSKTAMEDQVTVYVCTFGSCKEPAIGKEAAIRASRR